MGSGPGLRPWPHGSRQGPGQGGSHPAPTALRWELDRALDHVGRGDVVRLVQLLLDDPEHRHDGTLLPLQRIRVPAARSSREAWEPGRWRQLSCGEAHFDSVKAIFSSLSSENSKGVSAELISVSWCLNGPASFGEVAWSHRGLAVPVSSPRRHAGEGREGSPLVGGRVGTPPSASRATLRPATALALHMGSSPLASIALRVSA